MDEKKEAPTARALPAPAALARLHQVRRIGSLLSTSFGWALLIAGISALRVFGVVAQADPAAKSQVLAAGLSGTNGILWFGLAMTVAGGALRAFAVRRVRAFTPGVAEKSMRRGWTTWRVARTILLGTFGTVMVLRTLEVWLFVSPAITLESVSRLLIGAAVVGWVWLGVKDARTSDAAAARAHVDPWPGESRRP